MNSFFSQAELKERCRNPHFCIACFRVRDKVRVDEHHVCEECRRGSDGGNGRPRRLRVVTQKNGKSYFVDNRLRQLRNIHNPNDSIDYYGMLLSAEEFNDMVESENKMVRHEEFITVSCPVCGRILFTGTRYQAKRLILYCVQCDAKRCRRA